MPPACFCLFRYNGFLAEAEKNLIFFIPIQFVEQRSELMGQLMIGREIDQRGGILVRFADDHRMRKTGLKDGQPFGGQL